jgi:cellulose biosynthesis protein BcsQ
MEEKLIAITGDKGGVGKSTITALTAEWLLHHNYPVTIIDADPNQTTQTWIDKCVEKGRNINTGKLITIVDTAGTSGSSLSKYIRNADLILVPFKPHVADLKAKRKKTTQTNQTRQTDEKKSEKIVKEIASQPDTNQHNYTQSLSIRCNTLLYTTIQNWLTVAHTAQDFTYTSVADVIRAALEAYRNGLPLTELDQTGDCKQTTIRVTKTQADFYRGLPSQMRRKILERAIRTFIKNQ